MNSKPLFIERLSDLEDGQEADFFALLSQKEEATTRTGKPYWRVAFRDAGREVVFPVWSDSSVAVACRDEWTPGTFYKLRAVYRETEYGPQLDILKIRETTDADRSDGFDPLMMQPRAARDGEEMFNELRSLVELHIGEEPLRCLVLKILDANREGICEFPAATRNHHAYLGGYVEHVLSVTQNAVWLAEQYAGLYSQLDPPLSKDLIVAGAVLHDIGKLQELELRPEGAAYSASGHLVGHILQGRDMVREAAADGGLDPETQLRLEHIIVSHQRLPEWGSPKPPMTPEALLVHFADDIDAKFNMMVGILAADEQSGPFTGSRNALGHRVFRGLGE